MPRATPPNEVRDLAVGETRFENAKNGWMRVRRTPVGFEILEAKDAGKKGSALRKIVILPKSKSRDLTRGEGRFWDTLGETLTQMRSIAAVERFLDDALRDEPGSLRVARMTVRGESMTPFVPKTFHELNQVRVTLCPVEYDIVDKGRASRTVARERSPEDAARFYAWFSPHALRSKTFDEIITAMMRRKMRPVVQQARETRR